MKAHIRIINITFIFIFFAWLSSCDPFSAKQEITGNYYLWGDASIKESIGYLEPNGTFLTIISSDKFGKESEMDIINAVGYDNDFIIVKSKDPRGINMTDFVYYIIPLKNKLSEDPLINYYGPMAEHEFKSIRVSLNVPPDLDFSIFP